MIYIFFKETQDNFGVTSKRLAEMSGISEKHLSAFRNGKTNLSLDLLWQLVENLDELAPGARREFGARIAGDREEIDAKSHREEIDVKKLIPKISPKILIESMSKKQFAALLNAYADTLRQDKDSQSALLTIS